MFSGLCWVTPLQRRGWEGTSHPGSCWWSCQSSDLRGPRCHMAWGERGTLLDCGTGGLGGRQYCTPTHAPVSLASGAGAPSQGHAPAHVQLGRGSLCRGPARCGRGCVSRAPSSSRGPHSPHLLGVEDKGQAEAGGEAGTMRPPRGGPSLC